MAVRTLLRPAAIALAIAAVSGALYYEFVELMPTPGPSRVATGSRSCEAGQGAASVAADLEARIPVAAWTLGTREGEYAIWTKQITDGQVVSGATGMQEWLALSLRRASAAAASADRMAATLKVPRAPAFAPPHGREAFDAFQAWLEADAQPTAHGLAIAYAPWVCHLYKLGAYWGYSGLYRAAARNDANVFDGEIRHYAALVSLPPDLTERITLKPPRDMTDAQVMEDTDGITRSIAEYWAARKGIASLPR
jgi:hypothetical protein